MNLQKRYEKICNEYIQLFVEKHGYEFDGWIGNEVGGIASFIDQYFFSFGDIIFDINNNCEVGLIFHWQDDTIDHKDECMINYYSYSKGLRYEHL
jgi:hypothetical protein